MGKARKRSFTVSTLEQARVLADPLRFRILRAFMKQPRTTKQVADLLGEKAPRLYRHVETLREAGFLELVEERRKRGTVERYLRAVANRFEVDRSLFDPAAGSAGMGEQATMIRSLFATTEREVLRASEEITPDTDEALLPLVARLGGDGTRGEIERLRKKLLEWIEECERLEKPARGERHRFAGLIAFYPTDDSTLG